MLRIGVISDTHNYLDPKALTIFEGVEHILHAGDIGMPAIILQLESIAPVTAVMGNTDDPGLRYRQTEIIELAGRKFLLHHIINPKAIEEGLHRRIAREKPDVVVFGHTHLAEMVTLPEGLYVNSGNWLSGATYVEIVNGELIVQTWEDTAVT